MYYVLLKEARGKTLRRMQYEDTVTRNNMMGSSHWEFISNVVVPETAFLKVYETFNKIFRKTSVLESFLKETPAQVFS